MQMWCLFWHICVHYIVQTSWLHLFYRNICSVEMHFCKAFLWLCGLLYWFGKNYFCRVLSGLIVYSWTWSCIAIPDLTIWKSANIRTIIVTKLKWIRQPDVDFALSNNFILRPITQMLKRWILFWWLISLFVAVLIETSPSIDLIVMLQH